MPDNISSAGIVIFIAFIAAVVIFPVVPAIGVIFGIIAVAFFIGVAGAALISLAKEKKS